MGYSKDSLRRFTVFGALTLLILVLAVTFASNRMMQATNDDIPLPFGTSSDGSDLQGSVILIGNKNNIEVFRVAFPEGTDQEMLQPDGIYLVGTPDNASPVRLDAALSKEFSAGDNNVNYYGYQYMDATASVEKMNKNDPVFTNRFPGVFFVSRKARDEDAANGNGIANFEAQYGVTMIDTDSPNAPRLESNALYVFVVNENDGALITTRGLPWCGNAIVEGGEECDDGNTNNVDSCDNECRTVITPPPPPPPPATMPPATTMPPPPPPPSSVCGNGIREGTEECDDGNTVDDDDCDNTCHLTTPVPEF